MTGVLKHPVDTIEIRGLEIHTLIGVPDQERRIAQRLLVDITVYPLHDFDEMNDSIERTVDYDSLARRIANLAAAHPRHLIETLASDIAAVVLGEFPAWRTDVEVRKFILPNTDHVAVRCSRER